MDVRRSHEALLSYDAAITLKPGYAESFCNRGMALMALDKKDEALASYDAAIALNPALAEAHGNRGNVLKGLKRYDEAIASYDAALALEPDLIGAEGDRLHCKMQLCDWRGIGAETAQAVENVRSGKTTVSPFVFLGFPSSSADQLICARNWAALKHPPAPALWRGERYAHDPSASLISRPISAFIRWRN